MHGWQIGPRPRRCLCRWQLESRVARPLCYITKLTRTLTCFLPEVTPCFSVFSSSSRIIASSSLYFSWSSRNINKLTLLQRERVCFLRVIITACTVVQAVIQYKPLALSIWNGKLCPPPNLENRSTDFDEIWNLEPPPEDHPACKTTYRCVNVSGLGEHPVCH